MATPKVLQHTFYLLITIIISLSFAILGQFYIWQNVNASNVKPLEDFMFTYLPDFSEYFKEYPVPNWVFLAMIIVGLFSFDYYKVFQYAAQCIFLQSVLSGARGLLVGFTLLPLTVHNEACLHIPSTYFEAIENLIKYGSCGDFMWSGHTASAFLFYLFVERHHKHYAFQFVQGLLLGGMFLSLLVLHWHYTLDIVMALIASYLVFFVYKDYEEKSDYWFYFHEFIITDTTRKDYKIITNSQLS